MLAVTLKINLSTRVREITAMETAWEMGRRVLPYSLRNQEIRIQVIYRPTGRAGSCVVFVLNKQREPHVLVKIQALWQTVLLIVMKQ